MSGAEGPLRIAVAGGSIGGLCAGVALRSAGFDVNVYERISGPMETRGAGIVVQGELIDLLRTHGAGALPTTHCTVRRYLRPEGGEGEVQRAAQDFTSWEAIYRTLAAAFPSERYHRGAMLTNFENGKGSVRAHINRDKVVEADVLVAADGAQSPSRRHFLPDLSSTYAGYVAWRGTLDEADASPDLVRFFDDAFTFCEARSAGHILVYFIPGDAADSTPGRRRLNWVWYVGVNEADLPRILVDRDGRQAPRVAPVRQHAGLGSVISAISPGARCTRCWRPWWPQRASLFCRQSSTSPRRAQCSAGCAFLAMPRSSSGRTRPAPPPRRPETR
jgi:2-polyprenyl-6-methoxyphenol hydroxylase-like FAD-dependent oxidoreductase